MIQATLDRLGDLAVPERTWVITNRSLVGPIAEQLPQLDPKRIIGEPCKRDTAPAIGLAAMMIMATSAPKGATMLVMPADHLIAPDERFQAAIRQAVHMVEKNPKALVTFGIKPTYAAESFGYIERGESVPIAGQAASGDASPQFAVRQFREKPAKSVAEQYLASGNFYWNSGIFVWNTNTIRKALEQYEPEMSAHIFKIVESAMIADQQPEPANIARAAEVFDREFTAIRGKSIDFAVMERYSPVVVIEAPFTWDDVGSWQSLARTVGSDDAGNTAIGKHLGIRTSGSIIRTSPEHLVATLGVRDLIVVHTPDATLVADKHQEESIRELVKLLEQHGWREFL
jgi:mannose-1-phosphate guanylyltransferase